MRNEDVTIIQISVIVVLQDIQVRVTVSLQDNKADYNMMHI